MLKTLLLHLDGGARDAPHTELAARLARRHGAHLEAVLTEPEPGTPAGALGRGASAVYLAEADEAADRAADRLERQFRAAPAVAGLASAGFSRERGDAAAILARRSRTADLVLLGQGEDGGLAGAALADAGAPLLVVPRAASDGPSRSTVGERVLVAWDESAEAARAVRGALPLLTRAAAVTVLLVGEAGVLRQRLGPVREFLERHGVPAAPLLVSGPETDVGDIILARAAELGCDLVTMGAYGHSRLAELVLGGTTRHLLRRMRVPVLLAG